MSNRDFKVYIDGRFYPGPRAKISVYDHGVLYGDGVFEGIRVYNGRVFALKEHVDRLFASARAILLKVPLSPAQITEAVLKTCRVNRMRDGYIRLIVTRGPGTLGLNPNNCERGSVIIIPGPIQLYPRETYENGLAIITVPTTRNLHNAINPAIKSLNYLNNILAKIEALNAGCDEAVMLNAEGYVAECTGDNLFIVREGELQTPPLSAGALRGITRRVVMDLARQQGWRVSEPHLTRYDLYTADECFLTGTAAEIVPVSRIDGRIIGNGRPGPITLKLMELYRNLTRETGEPIFPARV